MKYIVILLSLIFFGFEVPIEKIKSSYGHIQAYYIIQPKKNIVCDNCYTSVDTFQEVNSINKKLKAMSYVKASSFVIKKTKLSTYSITSDHVCLELKAFLEESKFKILAKDLMSGMIDANAGNEIYSDIEKMYDIVPAAYVYSFEGVKHQISEIVLTDEHTDTCAFKSFDSWGTEVVLAKNGCYYEKIFNMSSTGGYYHEGAVSLREGFINNRAKKLEIEGKVFKDINIYTLIVKPGSSGSAVFNVKGEVCGSINISFIRVDLSAGASYSDLNRFYLKLQKKIR
jgi:hypothetical protein